MFFAVFGMLSLTSCDELTDCIASANPSLENKLLLDGFKGTAYADTISAEVKNDPNDNSYDYYFNVVGSMPSGLSYNVNHRRFNISGTPTQTGTFTFKLILRVDPPESYDDDGGFFNDGDRICFGDDTTERTYTIKIS